VGEGEPLSHSGRERGEVGWGDASQVRVVVTAPSGVMVLSPVQFLRGCFEAPIAWCVPPHPDPVPASLLPGAVCNGQSSSRNSPHRRRRVCAGRRVARTWSP
jgi:hypothetical protein